MTDTDPLGGIPSVGKKCLVSEHNVTFYCCLNEDILPVPEKLTQESFHELGNISLEQVVVELRYLD